MWLLVILSFLAGADPVPEKPKQKKADDAQATLQGIRDILDKVWNSPPENIKKTGTSILGRYRRQDANMASLEYAYGVALAKHQDWAAAEVNFRGVATKYRQSPRAWLAVANVHIRSGKLSLAIEDLHKAWEAAPKDEDVIITIAGVTNFLTTLPPPKFQADSAKKLRDEVRAALSPELRMVFDNAVKQSEDYINKLDTLRAELMEPIALARSQADAAEQEAREKGGKVEIIRAEYQRHLVEIQRIATTANGQVIEIDQSAQSNNGALSSLLQSQRAAIIQRSQAQIAIEETKAREVGIKLAQKEGELQEIINRAQRFAKEANDGKILIDKQLTLPPPYWDPASEKERLFADGFADIQLSPKENAKPRTARQEPSADEKARMLLSMADSLRTSDKPELAKSYLQRILKEFPSTPAATDAKWELEQVEKTIKGNEKDDAQKVEAATGDDEKPAASNRRKRKGASTPRPQKTQTPKEPVAEESAE